MEDRRNQVSPRGAIAYGLVCGAIGTFIILIALGAITVARPPEAPPRVGVCAGLVFILAGLALIVGYGSAGGVGADGAARVE